MVAPSRLLDLQAIDTAIDRLHARARALEREGEGRAKEAEEHATELRIAADQVAADTARELDAVSAELVTRRDERARLAAGIDPEILELYEDLRPQKKGVAAVTLVDGVCQGCHEKLSSVELDRVKRTDGVARCEYCRRILVL